MAGPVSRMPDRYPGTGCGKTALWDPAYGFFYRMQFLRCKNSSRSARRSGWYPLPRSATRSGKNTSTRPTPRRSGQCLRAAIARASAPLVSRPEKNLQVLRSLLLPFTLTPLTDGSLAVPALKKILYFHPVPLHFAGSVREDAFFRVQKPLERTLIAAGI